jgi:hypothetical protein
VVPGYLPPVQVEHACARESHGQHAFVGHFHLLVVPDLKKKAK